MTSTMERLTRRSFSLDDTDDAWTLPQKVFYPSNIQIGHSQLRHLISSPSPNIVYFVNGRQVFCLDTLSCTRILVTELPFKPICTASGFGWFCAGGEECGYFAAIRIPDAKDLDQGYEEHITGYTGRSAMLEHLVEVYAGLQPRVRVERLGSLILNSISLHLLHGSDAEVEDEVVAVLTNNDKTVRIYSLTQEKEIMRERFDFPMNHATISPDGRTLLIVGDKEVAYFYSRVDGKSEAADGRDGSAIFQHKSWNLLRQVKLHRPSSRGTSAYFTTAWSPSGRFCATGSENGMIILMDAHTVLDLDQDPVVAMVPSSRPDTTLGGVRSLCFAPDPWDLLIWVEDTERMCMADLRNGLHVRQVNVLDPVAPTVRRCDLSDANLSIPDSSGLTEQELQILDGLRTTRQRQERDALGLPSAASNPRSINYISPRNRQRLSNPAVLGSIRDYLRDHNWNSNGETSDGRPTSATRRRDPPTFQGSTSPPASRPGPPSSAELSSNPWHVIQAAMRSTRSATSSARHHATSSIDTPAAEEEGTTYLLPLPSAIVEDGSTLPPVPDTDDAASPHTRTTLSTLRNVNVNDPITPTRSRLRQSSDTAHRGHRAHLGDDLATDPAFLRSHIAELEAEVDATERQLLRGNGSSTPTPPPDSGPSERELAERRRRLLAIAAVSEEVSAERRRRATRDTRSASMTGGFPSVMWYSPRGNGDRDSALTTRGEAVLARQREQQDYLERQREVMERERAFENGPPMDLSSDRMRAAYEGSMQDIRRHGWMREEIRRRSRLAELSSDAAVESGNNNGVGWGTTGVAWGDGRVL